MPRALKSMKTMNRWEILGYKNPEYDPFSYINSQTLTFALYINLRDRRKKKGRVSRTEMINKEWLIPLLDKIICDPDFSLANMDKYSESPGKTHMLARII